MLGAAELTTRQSTSVWTHLAELFKVSMPLMMSQFIMALNGFISIFLLSFLSPEIFSASMLISSIQLIISVVPFALLFCISPIMSQIIGSKQEPQQIGAIFRAALVVSLIIAAIIMLILWYIEPIILLLKQPANLAPICDQFFKYFLWALPAMALTRVYFQLAMGLFKQQLVFGLSVLSFILAGSMTDTPRIVENQRRPSLDFHADG